MRELAQVLADWRSDATTLRTRGHPKDADLIEQLCKEVAEAAEGWLTFLNEADARLWSGLAADTLRKKYPGWSELGHARLDEKGHRIYRRAILPRRADLAGARQAARRAAESEDAA